MATPIPQNQVRFTLTEIVTATKGRLVCGDLGLGIRGVAIDSRAVVPGALFVAIRGETQDGVAYVSQAASQGAGALLVHPNTPIPGGPACIEVDDTTHALGELARYHRQRWGGRVIAIT